MWFWGRIFLGEGIKVQAAWIAPATVNVGQKIFATIIY
jgi:hypothetical protein